MTIHSHVDVANEAPAKVRPDADVIVIGAGPAGMSAAVELASAGRSVIVLDLQPSPGGQIFRALRSNLDARPGTDDLLSALGPTYAAGGDLVRSFVSAAGIDYRPGTTVWDLRADGTVGWLRGGEAGYLRARHVLLANGAMERPAPFSGWTLPGVMTAGAVQTLLKAGRLKPEGRIVLVGTGPLIFLLSDQLRRLGVRPELIARTDRFGDKLAALPKLRPSGIPAILKGLGWLGRLRLAGIPIRTGVSGIVAKGTDRVEAVEVTYGARRHELPCDLLIVHDGVVPAIDLAHCAGLEVEWLADDASWRPKTARDGRAYQTGGARLTEGDCRIRITGDARRIGGADAAAAHGRHAARAIIADLNGTPLDDGAAEFDYERAMSARPFIDAAFPPGLAAQLPDDQTVVCRCEEITAGALRTKISEGAADINLLRGILRCGMGPCQGRNCAVTLARILAAERPGSAVAPFRARPPLRPLPLGALANLTGIDPDLAEIQSLEDKPAASADGAHA